jgi:hypothetical protein
MILRLVSLIALASAVALANCGGSSKSSDSGTASPSTVAALRGGAVVTRRGSTPAPASSWDRLRISGSVYTGDDGGDRTTQTICSTLAGYLASIDDDNASRCLRIKRGVLATVEAIIPIKSSDPDQGFSFPHVKLRAADGTWSGFTTAVPLQPVIPLGTTIFMRKQGNLTINLAPRQGSDLDAGPNLGDNVTVKVLHYYPDTEDRSLYVTVLGGSNVGQNGWMFPNDGQTADGTAYTP